MMKRRHFFGAVFAAPVAVVAAMKLPDVPYATMNEPGWGLSPVAEFLDYPATPVAPRPSGHTFTIHLELNAEQFTRELKRIIDENRDGIQESIQRALERSTRFEGPDGRRL